MNVRNKKIKRQCSLLLLLVCSCLSAQAKFNYYVGAAVGQDFLRYDENYGMDDFKKRMPVAMFYFGVPFNEHFSAEIGYITGYNHTEQTLSAGGMSLGRPAATADNLDIYRRDLKIHGLSVGMMWHSPITRVSRLEWFAKLSADFLRVTAESTKIGESGSYTNKGDFSTQLKNGSAKPIPRLQLGMLYPIFCNSKLRFGLSFSQKSRIKQIYGQEFDGDQNTARFKSNIGYFVGFETPL